MFKVGPSLNEEDEMPDRIEFGEVEPDKLLFFI